MMARRKFNRNTSKVQKQTPIANDMFLPNVSSINRQPGISILNKLVGIGTDKPLRPLHIKVGTGGPLTNLYKHSDILIEDSVVSYIDFHSVNQGGFVFSDGDAAAGWSGYVIYDHAADTFDIGAAGASAISIGAGYADFLTNDIYTSGDIILNNDDDMTMSYDATLKELRFKGLSTDGKYTTFGVDFNATNYGCTMFGETTLDGNERLYWRGTLFATTDQALKWGSNGAVSQSWATAGSDHLKFNFNSLETEAKSAICVFSNGAVSPTGTPADPHIYICAAGTTFANHLLFYHDGTDGHIDTGAGDLILTPATGNVGIGTTTPTYMLDILADAGHFGNAFRIKTQGDNRVAFSRTATSKTNSIVFQTVDTSNWFIGQPDSNDYSGDGTDFYIGAAEDTPMFLINTSGNVGIGTNDPATLLDINADSVRVRTDQSPASDGTGTQGEIAWDEDYIYVCTATNTWKRAALTGGY